MSGGRFQRRDPKLSPEFRKDAREESFLRRLNDALVPLEREWHEARGAGDPALFVVGVPRSGTTLLTQVLCDSWDVGYPDHLVAAFPRAPVTGVLLSRKVLRERPRSSYESRFGRTDSIHEPHEFGYFWSERLGYEEPIEKDEEAAASIDWGGLTATLRDMIAAFGRPAVFKAFFLGWHGTHMFCAMPEARFAWIRRAPIDNAMSLLTLRRGLLGDEEAWASLRPAAWERVADLPVAEQVAAQVFLVEKSIAREVRAMNAAADDAGNESPIVVVDYSRFCADPTGELDRIRSLPGLGHVVYRGDPPSGFDARRSTGDEAEAAVRQALTRWYGLDANLDEVASLELLESNTSDPYA